MKLAWWINKFDIGCSSVVDCNAALPLACAYFEFLSDSSIADPPSRLVVLSSYVP